MTTVPLTKNPRGMDSNTARQGDEQWSCQIPDLIAASQLALPLSPFTTPSSTHCALPGLIGRHLAIPDPCPRPHCLVGRPTHAPARPSIQPVPLIRGARPTLSFRPWPRDVPLSRKTRMCYWKQSQLYCNDAIPQKKWRSVPLLDHESNRETKERKISAH